MLQELLFTDFRSIYVLLLALFIGETAKPIHALETKQVMNASDVRELLLEGSRWADNGLDRISLVYGVSSKLHGEESRLPKTGGKYFTGFMSGSKGERLWVSKVSTIPGPTLTPLDREHLTSIRVSDGSVVQRFSPLKKGKKSSLTSVGQALRDRQDRPLSEFFHYSVGMIWGHMGNGVSPKQLLLDGKAKIAAEPEMVRGKETFKISASVELSGENYRVEYWLSPEMSGMPVKQRTYTKDGVLFDNVDFEDFQKVGDRWFPWKVTRTSYSSRHIDKAGNPKPFSTKVFNVVSVDFETEPDSAYFNTNPSWFPVGTYVQDRVLGERYIIGQGPIGDSIVERIIDESIKKIDEIEILDRDGKNNDSNSDAVVEDPSGITIATEPDIKIKDEKATAAWMVAGAIAVLGAIVLAIAGVRKSVLRNTKE